MTSRTRSSRTKPTPPAPEPMPEVAEPATPRSPLFIPPEELPEPMPEATFRTTEDSPTPPLSLSNDQSGPAGAGSGSPFGTPSTADPSAKPAKPKLTRAALRGYARKAVQAVGGFVGQRLTQPDSIGRQYGLWVPDGEDVEAVADPVAGIVARRIPDKAARALNPDVEDGFALLLAIAQYVGKQLQKKAALQKMYADQGPADMTAGDVEAVPA